LPMYTPAPAITTALACWERRVWLLIVSGVGGIPSFFTSDPEILAASYPSPFSRIFLLELFGSRVAELNPRGGVEGPGTCHR